MPGHDLLTAPASAPAQEGSAPGSASDPTERASTIRDAFDAKVEQEFAEHSPGDIEYRAWEIADDVTAALLTEKTAHLRNRVWARAYNAALRALCHLLDDRDEVELRRQQVTKLVNEFRDHWIAEGNPDMSYAEIYEVAQWATGIVIEAQLDGLRTAVEDAVRGSLQSYFLARLSAAARALVAAARVRALAAAADRVRRPRRQELVRRRTCPRRGPPRPERPRLRGAA